MRGLNRWQHTIVSLRIEVRIVLSFVSPFGSLQYYHLFTELYLIFFLSGSFALYLKNDDYLGRRDLNSRLPAKF